MTVVCSINIVHVIDLILLSPKPSSSQRNNSCTPCVPMFNITWTLDPRPSICYPRPSTLDKNLHFTELDTIVYLFTHAKTFHRVFTAIDRDRITSRLIYDKVFVPRCFDFNCLLDVQILLENRFM